MKLKIKNVWKPPSQQWVKWSLKHKQCSFKFKSQEDPENISQKKLLVATGRWWLLSEASGCYIKVMVATGRGWLLQEASSCYRKVLVVTWSFWLLQEGDGFLSKVLVATGRRWLLQEGDCCYRKVMVAPVQLFLWQSEVAVKDMFLREGAINTFRGGANHASVYPKMLALPLILINCVQTPHKFSPLYFDKFSLVPPLNLYFLVKNTYENLFFLHIFLTFMLIPPKLKKNV